MRIGLEYGDRFCSNFSSARGTYDIPAPNGSFEETFVDWTCGAQNNRSGVVAARIAFIHNRPDFFSSILCTFNLSNLKKSDFVPNPYQNHGASNRSG